MDYPYSVVKTERRFLTYDTEGVKVSEGAKLIERSIAERTVMDEDSFTTKLKAYDMLDQDEIVKEIKIADMSDYVTGYEKVRIRTAIDFALLSLAYAYKLKDGKFEDVRLVFGGAAPVPVKLSEVEALLEGKAPSVELAKEAAELAVKNAVPMELNSYKVNQAKVLVEQLVLGVAN